MKSLFLSFTLALFSICAQAQDFEKALKAVKIPTDSTSPYDFRGTPTLDMPSYKKLFETKTYWELHEALKVHLKEAGSMKLPNQGNAKINAYFTCKQAYIRTCYMFGYHGDGDHFMQEFHPKFKANPDTLEKQLRLAAEDERIKRTGDLIREMTSDMGNVFPNGPPKDIHELYAPILKVIRELQGG